MQSQEMQPNKFPKHAKTMTATYHNLPNDIDLTLLLLDNFARINEYLILAQRKEKLVNMLVVKEAYNAAQDTDKKELFHLHALIELDKIVKIHTYQTFAKLFTIVYNQVRYTPHISVLVNNSAYMRYITKLQLQDEKYNNSEWFCSYPKNAVLPTLDETTQLDKELNHMFANMSKLSKHDMTKVLDKYSKEVQMKHKVYIDYLFSKLPNNRERIEDYVLDPQRLKYLASSYDGNLNFKKILNELTAVLDNPQKYSLQFVGPSNIGKTSMIWAAITELQKQGNHKLAAIEILDYDDAKRINELDLDKVDYLFTVFDDCDINKEWRRSDIKNLLQGNERGSVLQCRYENAKFEVKHIKIFVHNIPFDKLLNPMLPEYQNRLKIIKLSADISLTQLVK